MMTARHNNNLGENSLNSVHNPDYNQIDFKTEGAESVEKDRTV